MLVAGLNPEIVSLLVALSALALSAASLWHSSLKPAEIELEHLPQENEVAQGGINDVPALYTHRLAFAVTNSGARSGLLESFEVGVHALGASEFAEGVRALRDSPDLPRVQEDGPRVELPTTIEAGDVRAFELAFDIAGPFLTEAWTTSVNPPNYTPLALMVSELTSVEINVGWTFRRRVRLLPRKRRKVHRAILVSIPGSTYQERAATHWDQGHKRLATIARGEGTA